MKMVSFRLSIVFKMLVEVSMITPNLTSEGRLFEFPATSGEPSWLCSPSWLPIVLDNDHAAFLPLL